MGAVAALVMLIVIVLVAGSMIWAYFVRTDGMKANLEQGCVPLSDDRYGIATSYSCPRGTVLK